MPQYTLHDDFVVDFLQELISKTRVEDLLDGDWCTIQEALMNYRKATLRDLLSYFDVVDSDFSYSWNLRQTPGLN